jgi:hypothetical protein
MKQMLERSEVQLGLALVAISSPMFLDAELLCLHFGVSFMVSFVWKLQKPAFVQEVFVLKQKNGGDQTTEEPDHLPCVLGGPTCIKGMF